MAKSEARGAYSGGAYKKKRVSRDDGNNRKILVTIFLSGFLRFFLDVKFWCGIFGFLFISVLDFLLGFSLIFISRIIGFFFLGVRIFELFGFPGYCFEFFGFSINSLVFREFFSEFWIFSVDFLDVLEFAVFTLFIVFLLNV